MICIRSRSLWKCILLCLLSGVCFLGCFRQARGLIPSSTFLTSEGTQHQRRPTLVPSYTFLPSVKVSCPTYQRCTILQSTATPINNEATILNNEDTDTNNYIDDTDDPFTLLSTLAATTLLQSDRTAVASSAKWIDEGSSFMLKSALDKVMLYLPGSVNAQDGRDIQDEAITWLRWMRSIPRPLIVDLSDDARRAANSTVSDDFLRLLNTDDDESNETNSTQQFGLQKLQQLRTDFFNRLQCNLILIPSGQSMNGYLFEPSGTLTFGKLLYGGVTRYRILPSYSGSSEPRRAGERTERKSSKYENIPAWIQYGGTERRYEAVDMGPACVLELSLLPKMRYGEQTRESTEEDMMINRFAWNPQSMFRYIDNEQATPSDEVNGENTSLDGTPASLHGKDRNDAFSNSFTSRVGGLQPQIDAIVRRVLDGRIIRPAEVDSSGNLLSYKEAKQQLNDDELSSLDDAAKQISHAALEAEELAMLGLSPVRGLLLYGPPGCGKTALAREIARALRARAPKIVSAPELLDRWVGGSEKLVRELFHDAESELASVNGDASRSALHVIVIDEIDAVFRQRSSAEDSGEATRSSTVNQILSKLDGVKSIPNVLLIGMTNRRELLDDALLRPGRLEVQIEIPLPDKEGRREIMQIHFGALRSRGRLSKPLCCAIDGKYSELVSEVKASSSSISNEDEPSDKPNRGRKRRAIKQATGKILGKIPGNRKVYDLADDSNTKGFSGADIEGLVRCAGSIALARAREDGGGVEALLITLDDVKQALTEVKE